MPFLQSKKDYYPEDEQDLFCGEEMKPYIAYPRGEEEPRNAEPKPEPVANKLPEGPSSRRRRFWNRLSGILVLK